MSLKRKAKINALSGVLLFVANTVITLLLNPLLILYLGHSSFGLIKSAENLLSFASVANGKSTQALKWIIANQASFEDVEEKKRAVTNSLINWFIFLPVLSVVVYFLVKNSSLLINDLNPEEIILFKSIMLALGINLIITPLFGVAESLLIGLNKGYLVSGNLILWSIISAILVYVLLIQGYGADAVVYVTVAVTVFRGLNLFRLCVKKHCWFGLTKTNRQSFLSFFKFSGFTLIWSFIARFLLGGEVLIIGYFLGGESVAKFVISSYPSIVGISIISIILSSITPGLGMIIGKKDYLRSYQIVALLREVSFFICLILSLGILFFNKYFVGFWIGDDSFVGSLNNFLIALLLLQTIFIRTESLIIDLSLNLKVKVIWGVVSVLLSILFCNMFIFLFGLSISSILIGLFAGRSILLVIFPIMTNNIFVDVHKKAPVFIYAIGCVVLLACSFLNYKLVEFEVVHNVILSITIFIFATFFNYIFLLSIESKVFFKSQLKYK